MNSEELKSKAFSGVIWSFINQFGTQILAIAPAMILARLLSPSEYGIIAMASIFNGFAFVLSSGGFNDALLQKKNVDHLDYCSVYYFNIFVNIFFYLVFFFIAPFCANFFNEPLVTSVMRVSLLSLPLLAIGGVHAIILRRNLNFKVPAIRNIIVQIVSAMVAIIMALSGCGVWSLVVQGVIQTLGNSVINILLCSWRPSFTFSFKRLKQMFSYGIKIYFSGIVYYGFGKTSDATIAKVYSPADLSYYNRAYSTANIFINSFVGVINNVAFPMFARMQGNIGLLKRGVGQFVSISSMISIFLMLQLFVLSEPLFNFLYSSKWNSVIPYFQVVCIWGIFQPIKSTLEGFLRATGCAGLIMYNRIISNILLLGNVYLGYKFGILYMLYGQISLEILQICFFSYFTKKFYGYGFGSIFFENIVYLIPALLVASVTFLVDVFAGKILEFIAVEKEFFSSLLRLLGAGGFGLISFVLIYRTLNLPAYRKLVELVLKKIGHHNTKMNYFLGVLIKK